MTGSLYEFLGCSGPSRFRMHTRKTRKVNDMGHQLSASSPISLLQTWQHSHAQINSFLQV
jgi:hypothetical protein